ncbi:hypothetical protein GSI_09152 [Ganoderma sinense ZZ0214-1]|uniref:Uncharacterized protein n=1 Tax=Ganoderma sinense ZZ0214-1 TaxID=1077348 RepID=A0A2G8S5U1_9APHY|nr:hypothetical protein GSI_09152 [Ganoderma sinense ZZ0214-1]
MDRRSRPTDPNSPFGLSPSPVSSLANSTFFSVTSPSTRTPLANLSGGGPHYSGSPSQPSIPSPSGSSPFLVPRMWDAMVDVGQEIRGTLDAQDRASAMIADVSAPSGVRPPNAASDIDFDHHVREPSTRRLGRHGFVDNIVLSRPSAAPMVMDEEDIERRYCEHTATEVQGEGARLVQALHLASERQVPRGQDNDNGRPFGFEQQKETSVSYAHDERSEKNEHGWQAEIQSVSARLEQTREEIIPLLKQVAHAVSVRREVLPTGVATSVVTTSGVRPQETIEVLSSVTPSFPPEFVPRDLNHTVPTGRRFPMDVVRTVLDEPKPVTHYDLVRSSPLATHPDNSPLSPAVVRPPESLLLSRPLSEDQPDVIPRQLPRLSTGSSPRGPLYPLHTSSSDHPRPSDGQRSQPRTPSRSRQRYSGESESAHSLGRQQPDLSNGISGRPSPPRMAATVSDRPQSTLDLLHHERFPATSVVASQLELSDHSEKREPTEVLEQDDVIRNQPNDHMKLVTEQQKEALRIREPLDKCLSAKEKDAQYAATRNMLEQILANQVHMRNEDATSKELMEEMRNNQLQALNSIEQQRIVSEETIREMTEAWRANHEQQKTEIIEAVKAAANEQVPYNIQGYLDEFSRSLATEVRMLLSEVGKLREDKRNLEFQIGELLTFQAKYGPEGQFDPSWKPSMTCVPAEAAPAPDPYPEPDFDGPQHAPSAWRTIPTRGSRRSRRTQAAPPPPPPEPVPPPSTQSWATWQSNPVFQPSPPMRPIEHLEPPQGSSGLFGSGSPRDSLATENRMLLIEVGTLQEDMRNLDFQIGEYVMLKAKSDLDDESLSSQKPTAFRRPTSQPVSPSRSQGHQRRPSSSSRGHSRPSRIPRRVQATRLPPPPPPEPVAPPVTTQSWTTWQPNPAFQPSPPVQPVEHLLGPPQGSPGLFGPRSPRDSVVR